MLIQLKNLSPFSGDEYRLPFSGDKYLNKFFVSCYQHVKQTNELLIF